MKAVGWSVATWLLTVALGGILLATMLFFASVLSENGSFAFVFFGVPLICALIGLAAEILLPKFSGTVVVWIASVLLLGWSLLLGLGGGFISFCPR